MEVKEEEVEVKVEDGQSKYLCPDCHKRFLYSFTLGRHMAAQECLKEVKLEEIASEKDHRGNYTPSKYYTSILTLLCTWQDLQPCI
jgi:hypothetical protein